MRPLFEKVTVPAGASWALLDRRLDDGIPFQWHYHPEFELTLTLNSRGQRYVGDSVDAYDDGDLVLLGPNLPHTWCSAERIAADRPHHALVMWFTEEWGAGLTGQLPEMRGVAALLSRAGRGIAFSPEAATRVRPAIESIPGEAPSRRLLSLIGVLAALAEDEGAHPIAGPGSGRIAANTPDRARIERVLDHIHAHYRGPIAVETLAELACLSPSGFHRLFRRHTRLTLTAYVAELRIGQACALLINTERPIAHIAEEAGYRSLANFNRQFLAAKGMTPRAFRRSFAG
jgi:AraC-like DNA-binding protein